MISMLIISIVALIGISICLFFFLFNWIRYRYIGNRFIYLGVSFIICLLFSLYINFNLPYKNVMVPVGTSIFDSLKMAVVSIDASKLQPYYSKEFIPNFFIVQYFVTSIVTLGFLSLTVVLTFIRSFSNSFVSLFRRAGKDAKIYYIFTDSKVTVSVKLAQQLLKKVDGQRSRNSVTVFVSSASLKTQEGTEFRDMLVSKGIHVRGEAFTENLAQKLFNWHFRKNRKNDVVVYCMFSDDETSSLMANYFQNAITKNKVFQSLNDKLGIEYSKIPENYKNNRNAYDGVSFDHIDTSILSKFKIFITYHYADIDLIYGYSKNTLHIINTLSQYDMISSEFLLDNPICNFVDFSKVSETKDLDSMHVTFLGFGMVNRPIFEKMTYSYQLWGDNVNKVHYHILDRNSNALVKCLSNEYTEKNKEKYHPFLYSVDGDLDGEDLTEYEIIDEYVKKLFEKNEPNRFAEDGFELFIISFAKTNSDLMCAINIRNALVKYYGKERLKKTYIFVRVGDGELISENLLDGDVIRQKDFANIQNNAASIIVFGENALMPTFIAEHYNSIIESGIKCQFAYDLCQVGEDVDKKALYKIVKYCWLDKNKKGILQNTRAYYSLQGKNKLFALANEEQIKTMKDPKTFLEYDLAGNPIIKIANLEHNRWLAANYVLNKSTPMSFDEYLKGPVGNTKTNDGHVHVCMTTNEGLLYLYKTIEDKKKAFAKFYEVDIKTIEIQNEDFE